MLEELHKPAELRVILNMWLLYKKSQQKRAKYFNNRKNCKLHELDTVVVIKKLEKKTHVPTNGTEPEPVFSSTPTMNQTETKASNKRNNRAKLITMSTGHRTKHYKM